MNHTDIAHVDGLGRTGCENRQILVCLSSCLVMCSCSSISASPPMSSPYSNMTLAQTGQSQEQHAVATPTVTQAANSSMAQTPIVVTNMDGQLTPNASAALLKKRWHGAYQDLRNLAAMEQDITGNPLIDGNQVALLHDGPQTMAAMIAAIKSAKHHIHLETYIFDQDALGTAFAKLLIERQTAGIQVRIIYDSVGTIGTPMSFFDELRAAGIELLEFHPFNPITAAREMLTWNPNQRDHRKLLVVDGEVAFTGGINISNSYASSSLFRSKRKTKQNVGWRDTHIRVKGPAVAAIQQVFLNTWIEEKKLKVADFASIEFFPPLAKSGTQLVRVLASAPQDNQDIYQAYLLAINQAQHTIHITCAYFVPDQAILQALSAAVQRGVEVKLILPGVNDNDLVSQASKSYFSEMLDQGIALFQLNVAVLHAKTAVIDSQWSTVGSANIDTRSFVHNREINVMVFSPTFGLEMESAFTEDLRSSTMISKQMWQERSMMARLQQWFARRFAYWL